MIQNITTHHIFIFLLDIPSVFIHKIIDANTIQVLQKLVQLLILICMH